MSKLLKSEKESIKDLIQTYRELHDKINEVENGIEAIEKEMKRLYSQKDSIIDQIQANREREIITMKALEDKYGLGKLDLDDMSWVTNN